MISKHVPHLFVRVGNWRAGDSAGRLLVSNVVVSRLLHAETENRLRQAVSLHNTETTSTALSPVGVSQAAVVGGRLPPAGTGLEVLKREELVFLFDQVSRSGVKDPNVWDVYASRVRSEIRSCSLDELCSIVRSFCRASFAKRSLLNAVCRRLRAEAKRLPPRMLAQAVSDLRKMGQLDGPLLMALANGARPRLQDFSTFDLPLLLCAFANTSLRDEQHLNAIGHLLQSKERRAELTPTVVSTSIRTFALLDSDGGGAAAMLVASAAPRCLTGSSRSELVNLIFALVISDSQACELLSYALERLARGREDFPPWEVHALRIVERCLNFPASLRPKMRQAFDDDPSSLARAATALHQIMQATGGVDVQLADMSEKRQRRLERYFDRLQLPRIGQRCAGPYVLDYVLPHRVVVEVHSYKHFYAYSQRLTAKAELKLRLLQALGFRVLGIPYFEWLPLNDHDRLVYLEQQLGAVTGLPMSALRRPDDPEDVKHFKKPHTGNKHWWPSCTPPSRVSRLKG